MLRQLKKPWPKAEYPGPKTLALSSASGILLGLAFFNFHLSFLAWFSFLPLFFCLENTCGKKAFILAYLCGVFFWWVTIYWLVHVTFFGTFLLILYLALYFGFFGLLIANYQLPITNYHIFLIPSIWVLLEYLRAKFLTGFPWALLAYSQYKNLVVIQSADIFGAYGVSFLIMLANVLIYFLLRRRRVHILAPAFILLCLSYGYLRLYQLSLMPMACTPVNISVIQGNIPQDLKWDLRAKNFILERYSKLSRDSSKTQPELIIWPEASSPALFGEDEAVFSRIYSLNEELGIPLLIGAPVKEADNYFNAALLLDKGRLLDRYDKLHLVPFGEYVPLKRILPFLKQIVAIGDFTPGDSYTLFRVPGTIEPVNFAVLICFEDLFTELSMAFKGKGAGFLVVITNDAWYKKSPAAFQHLAASVFRAVECRIPVVRSANTGVSGFIDQAGQIVALIQDTSGNKIFVQGFETKSITPSISDEPTIYCRFPFIFILACFFFLLYIIAKSIFKKKT